MRYYMTFETAQRRVEQLRKQGVWPGITGPDSDGRYWLQYDPGDNEATP
jgi:hypothetical protein